MDPVYASDVKIDLQQANGAWSAIVERDGQRQEVGGIRELIRYLETLATVPERPARGLR